MVITKVLPKNSVQSGKLPHEVLEEVIAQLCANNPADMFVTVWLGIVEISTGRLICANAGHEYPALRRAGGAHMSLCSTSTASSLQGWRQAATATIDLSLQ